MTSPLSPSILWGGTLLIKYDLGSIWSMECESTFFLHTYLFGCKAALPILVPKSQSNMTIRSMPATSWLEIAMFASRFWLFIMVS